MYALIPFLDDPRHPFVKRMLKEKALGCPTCDAEQAKLSLLIENRVIRPRYVVACEECKYLGPLGKDAADAIKKWNGPSGFLAMLKSMWGKKQEKQYLLRAYQQKRCFL